MRRREDEVTPGASSFTDKMLMTHKTEASSRSWNTVNKELSTSQNIVSRVLRGSVVTFYLSR